MSAFTRPELWPALLAAPLVWWLLVASSRRAAATWRDAFGSGAARAGVRAVAPRRATLGRAATASGVACVAVALMGPAWGAAEPGTGGTGGDVVICLDVSRSMLAADDRPTRLRRAQEEIAELAAIPGGRLGLVAFAGEARVVAPLTHDRRTVGEMASLCDDASVTVGGSDAGAALRAALSLVPSTSESRASIVILTDSDRGGDAMRAAAAAAAKRNIPVHVIAFGAERGAKIPLDGRAGFLQDRSGRDVVAAADRSMLRDAARAGAGTYREGREPGALAALHASSLASLPAPPDAARVAGPPARRSRAGWFLAAALALWLCELALRRTL